MNSEGQSRKFKKGDCHEMTAFERYGVKTSESQYATYSFQERLNHAQWRDAIERCRVQRSTLTVRALAAASGGSAGRCGYIRTYTVKLHHRYSTLRNRIGIIYYCVLCGIVTTPASCIKYPYDVTSCVTIYVNNIGRGQENCPVNSHAYVELLH